MRAECVRRTGALVLALAIASSSASAQAESPDEAHRAAQQAAEHVDRLTAEIHVLLYDRAVTLQALADGTVASSTQLQAAREQGSAAAAAHSARGARARAAYVGGGDLHAVASLLASGDPNDFARRARFGQAVARADAAMVRLTDAMAREADARAGEAEAGRDVAVVDAATVTDQLTRVQGLLIEAEVTVARLSDRARTLSDTAATLARIDAARREAQAAAAIVPSAAPRPAPEDFARIYVAAARTCPGLSWTILSAVGQVESGHGRHNGPSLAGAEGPMQFLPATFDAYAVDGDGDGLTDIWNAADSVFTAAHYLCANGAGTVRGLYGALWRYNHADWYVRLVLGIAAALGGPPLSESLPGGQPPASSVS